MHTDNGQRMRAGQRNKRGRGSICESSGLEVCRRRELLGCKSPVYEFRHHRKIVVQTLAEGKGRGICQERWQPTAA